MSGSAYRDPKLVKMVLKQISEFAPSDPVKLCHVCGTHEWTITHSSIRSIIPGQVSLVAGPGCPVCIVPAREIDEAVWLAMNGVTVATFGDMYRVPGSEMSLADARSRGGDVRVVYSVRDAVEMATRAEQKDLVFFAIGFETTAPMNALEISRSPSNMSYLVSHRLIPPAMELLIGMEGLDIDGFIAPGHVTTIIGSKAYRKFAEEYLMPTVVAGFEALDVLMAVHMLLRQIREGRPKLENEYARASTYEGNARAQEIVSEVFDVVDGAWRGIGIIEDSALRLKEEHSQYDARLKYDIDVGPSQDIHPGCSCHLVLIGKVMPSECPLYMESCTPERPKGACMVSSEGTCRAWASHEQL